MSIDFTINGEVWDMPVGTTLTNLVAELNLNDMPLTIKINGKRLFRKDWQQEIQAGDRVEIGQAVPHSCVTVEV